MDMKDPLGDLEEMLAMERAVVRVTV